MDYVQDDGTVLAPPGAYNETSPDPNAGGIYHVWGATKILYALAEDYRRTQNAQSRVVAQKIIDRLKDLAIYPSPDKCYFPAGMGAMTQDGAVIPNLWNKHPAPVVESLVNYYLATGDNDALDFAKAYAEGIMAGSQPDGIRFDPNDGSFDGHSHATMHALWGISHLGVVTNDSRYIDFTKKTWDWMLTRGTGAGWFPATATHENGDNVTETCLISDMISHATLIARGGNPEYFDYADRYLRNYISNLQFVVTPEFETYYRNLHPTQSEETINHSLAELRKFQGGIVGLSGLNDYENELLPWPAFEMFGCCAPEGMRAIYTVWNNTIDLLPDSEFGPAGVYVNMGFSRDSPWGQVVSFFPDVGRLSVEVAVDDDSFFLRPPHWVPHEQVYAFVDGQAVPVVWSGSYVRFDNVNPGDELTITYPLVGFSHEVSHEEDGIWPHNPDLEMGFQWLGNMVTEVSPEAQKTPLYTGGPRLLGHPPYGFTPGDLNGDGFVGGDDLDIVRSFWGQTVTPGDLLHGDASGNGIVSGQDLDIVRAHWGEGMPPGPAGVPESSALMLLASGVVGFLLARRRR